MSFDIQTCGLNGEYSVPNQLRNFGPDGTSRALQPAMSSDHWLVGARIKDECFVLLSLTVPIFIRFFPTLLPFLYIISYRLLNNGLEKPFRRRYRGQTVPRKVSFVIFCLSY